MRPLHIFFAILVSFIWGVNFVVAKIGITYFPPIFLMGIRFTAVFILLAPFVKFPKEQFKQIVILSLTFGALYHSLIFSAIAMGIEVSASIIAIQLNVPMTSLLACIFLKDKIGKARSIGMVIAFGGILILFGSPNIQGDIIPFMMAIAAALMWAISNLQLKRMGDIKILPVLAWLSLFTGVELLFVSAIVESGQIEALNNAGIMGYGALTYMIIFSTIIAFCLWYHLLAKNSVHLVVPFSLLIPVFGILSSIIYLKEHFTLQMAIGGLVTITGVAIIIFRRPKLSQVGNVN